MVVSTCHAIECKPFIATTLCFVARMLVIMASDACNHLRQHLLIEHEEVMFGVTFIVGSEIRTYAAKGGFYFTDYLH